MTEEENLLRHLSDLSAQADRKNIYTYSGFLSLPEIDLLKRAGLSTPYSLFGGTESAERQIAVFGSEEAFGYEAEPPVSVLEIAPVSEKFGEELSHRDYLGAILNLGIDRSLTGDIVIREKKAWLFCLDSIAGYIAENLLHIRHTEVTVKDLGSAKALSDLPELKPVLQKLQLNVASERLDAVTAAFLGQSRNHTLSCFSQKLVYVNSRLMTDVSYRLKENDVLNVRGFGKAIYTGISGESKKGRLYVTLMKYV